jgi:hypothetical protein
MDTALHTIAERLAGVLTLLRQREPATLAAGAAVSAVALGFAIGRKGDLDPRTRGALAVVGVLTLPLLQARLTRERAYSRAARVAETQAPPVTD